MTTFPRTAGELLTHLKAAAEADNWILSTDMADARDQHGSLRRTFRHRALGDADCAIVCEFGNLFVVLNGFDVALAHLHRPRLRDVVAPWATSDHMAFIDALERAFPRATFVATT